MLEIRSLFARGTNAGRKEGKESEGREGTTEGREEELSRPPGCAGGAGRGYACQLEGIQLSIA